MIFTIVDIIATVSIGLFTLLAPDLTITAFKKEQGIVILLIIVGTMILLSIRPLTTKIQFFNVRIILGLILTIVILYMTFSFLQWYFFNIEGTFSFRFLSFEKRASFEKKLDLYKSLTSQMIDLINQKNTKLALYLEQSPRIMNPNTSIIMHTAYNAIPALAEKAIHTEVAAYEKMISNINKSANGLPSDFNAWYYLKIISFVAITTLGVYLLFSYGDLASKVKKGFGYLENTQEELKKVVVQSATDALLAKQVNQDIINLSDITTKLVSNVETLSNTMASIDELKGTVLRLTFLVNNVIRPCMRSIFLGIKHVDSSIYESILKNLNSEQKDFMTGVSKLIFV